MPQQVDVPMRVSSEGSLRVAEILRVKRLAWCERCGIRPTNSGPARAWVVRHVAHRLPASL